MENISVVISKKNLISISLSTGRNDHLLNIRQNILLAYIYL